MRLRYQGSDPREGWVPGEEREVSHDEATALLATGIYVAVVVASPVIGPEIDRTIHAPGGRRWR